MSIALAASGIREEWNLSQEQLGFLLPLEFIGMAVGSVFLGSLADKRGRRLTIILCLIILTIGMAISAWANNLTILAASRVFTGVGIGGILACATALTSEYSNGKYRSIAVIIIAAGYTIGIFAASKIAGPILMEHDWRLIFKIGAIISMIFIPVFWFIVPESIAYLERTKPDGAAGKIKKTLQKLGHPGDFVIADIVEDNIKQISIKELFQGDTKRITCIMMICYLGNIMTYYFFVKWMPPAVFDLGFSKAEGTEVLAMISLGGLAGSIGMAILTRFFELKKLMVLALTASGASVALFPLFTGSLDSMLVTGFIGGFWLFAAIGGFFALFAQSFPPAVLASGTGVVLGFGRGGAVMGPWAGGLLFGAGLSLAVVSPLMALGSVVAGLSLLFLPSKA